MRLIIVSNRLPVTVVKNKNGEICFKRSVGGLATGLDSYLRSKFGKTVVNESLWIGWPGVHVEKKQENKLKSDLLTDYNCYPVFLKEEQVAGFYAGFCNKTIWPLFHYFSTKTQFNPLYWNQYKEINSLFATAVNGIVNESDIIWIHDYHLMLLPQLIRQSYRKSLIGFFLHIPFPSYEVFRLLASQWRIDLLKGIVGADVVGFHTIDYVQHFKQSLLKILDVESENNKVILDGRVVKLDCFPMGIDFNYFSQIAHSIENKKKVDDLRKSFNDNKLILSIDRLDYTKGIINRLLAFEGLLEKFPEWLNKVNLLLVVVPSRVDLDTYQEMKRDIDGLVGKINGKFSNTKWLPISYQYNQFETIELVTLYSSSDIALVTPLRDGMNLIAKEYIASQINQSGVLILSEMAGASQELLESELINPYHINEITTTLFEVLNQKSENQVHKNSLMENRLKAYDLTKWIEDFLQEIIKVRNENLALNERLLSQALKEKIGKKFLASKKRLILLDYDGTLVPFEKLPELAIPSSKLLKLLSYLSENKDNKVVILSGRDRFFLEKWFGGLKIDFGAENGYWIKQDNQWKVTEYSSSAWKETVTSVLEKYINKLPGSFIEDKEFSLTWHYRNADAKLSEIRTMELIEEFEKDLKPFNINFTRRVKCLEISGLNISKRGSLSNWVDNNYDFICSIGDDGSDEDVFNTLPSDAYTIKVGIDETSAKYIVKDSFQVIEFIEHITFI